MNKNLTKCLVKKAKPDFLDMDGDGNKTESREKAVKDKEAKKDKKDVKEGYMECPKHM